VLLFPLGRWMQDDKVQSSGTLFGLPHRTGEMRRRQKQAHCQKRVRLGVHGPQISAPAGGSPLWSPWMVLAPRL
ncbi:hypothetical protein M513_09304, partial [Trichuris suis]